VIGRLRSEWYITLDLCTVRRLAAAQAVLSRLCQIQLNSLCSVILMMFALNCKVLMKD